MSQISPNVSFKWLDGNMEGEAQVPDFMLRIVWYKCQEKQKSKERWRPLLNQEEMEEMYQQWLQCGTRHPGFKFAEMRCVINGTRFNLRRFEYKDDDLKDKLFGQG